MAASTNESQEVIKKVYRAFFSPPKYEAKSTEQGLLERGKNFRVPFAAGELAVTTWGDGGGSILLMHGWGGSRAQMTGFVGPLLEAGYRVVAYDQPAHGDSSGTMTNILEITPSLEIMAAREGKFDAIIGHSFGTLVSSYALANEKIPLPARLIYFGAINRLLDSVPRFQVQANLPDKVIQGFSDMLVENFGRNVLESIVNEELIQQIKIPALMFHDTSDSVTPIEDSRAIARNWKSAKLIETQGLGHRGALQSKDVHAQVVNFLKS